jgi:hypothetical protein
MPIGRTLPAHHRLIAHNPRSDSIRPSHDRCACDYLQNWRTPSSTRLHAMPFHSIPLHPIPFPSIPTHTPHPLHSTFQTRDMWILRVATYPARPPQCRIHDGSPTHVTWATYEPLTPWWSTRSWSVNAWRKPSSSLNAWATIHDPRVHQSCTTRENAGRFRRPSERLASLPHTNKPHPRTKRTSETRPSAVRCLRCAFLL